MQIATLNKAIRVGILCESLVFAWMGANGRENQGRAKRAQSKTPDFEKVKKNDGKIAKMALLENSGRVSSPKIAMSF